MGKGSQRLHVFYNASGGMAEYLYRYRQDRLDRRSGIRNAKARLNKLNVVFGAIEDWTMTKTKFEVMQICNPLDIPVGPILSMKEISEEKSLRETGTIVQVEHPERGAYLTVGCPVKLSASPAEVKRSPLLGEHNEEILKSVLGYEDSELQSIIDSGAIG